MEQNRDYAMDKCDKLLSKVSENSKKYSEHGRLTGYNVFQVMEVNAKEVLMCRMLADLLNPQGQHGQGSLFLSSFLTDVLKRNDFTDLLLAHTQVETEYVIEKDRRIDIMIHNSRFAIPIEAKIYAGEQAAQCYDYYETARHSQVIYLTCYGSVPSPLSRTKRDGSDVLPPHNILCISWQDDICGWLTDCLGAVEEPVKSVVMQYIDAIRLITDHEDRIRMKTNMEILYESSEYFGAALEVEKVIKRAKLHLIRLVFDDFREEMRSLEGKYGLEPETKTAYYSYESRQHDRFYDSSGTTFPGLNYVVKNARYSNKNLQLWFRIEIEYQLFAGLALFDTAATGPTGNEHGYQVNEITESLILESVRYVDPDIIVPTDWWLTWCYPNGKCQDGLYEDVPNFKTMNPCAIELVDAQMRRQFVKRAVGVFEEQILRYMRQG